MVISVRFGTACIGRGHSAAVVDDLNECTACIFEDYRDLCGTGIDGIFDKFLDDGCRALYDFTGSNLVGHRVG